MIKNTIQQHYRLIFALGTIAIIRPLAKMTNLIHLFPTDKMGSILLTILISVIWFSIVCMKRPHHPVIVLASSGLVYAIWAILLSAVFSPLLTGSLQGPLTNPLAIISVLLTNLIWGTIVGCLALPFLRKNH